MSRTVDAEGGCACGAMRLRMRGAVITMSQCWCSECQKETGGGATNSVILQRDDVELTGEVGVYRRRSESGNEVSHRFCRTCANVLTAEVEGTHFAAVRAGVFDDGSFFEPQMILYRASALGWARFLEGAQQFDKQPSAAA